MIGTEMNQLKNEYQRITTLANFNEQSLLNGSGTLNIQVGIDGTSNDAISINDDQLTTTLGAIASLATVFTTVTSSTASTAVATANLANLDNAINALSTRRATRFFFRIVLKTHCQSRALKAKTCLSSQSQILDVDYASESANMTRYQIQSQAGVVSFGSRKAIPQSIISLLS